MKLPAYLTAILLGCHLIPNCVHAAVVLDSFTDGAVALNFDGPTGQFDVLPGSFLNERRARGAGDKDWSATSNPTSGSLSYTVDLRGTPSGDNWFNLSYRSTSGTSDLLGIDGFALNVTSTQGVGDLVVFFGETPWESLFIPINGPGKLYYPLSNIITGHPPDEVPQLQFRFVARTAGFSVTLNEITMIPEHSPAVLAGIGAVLVLRRRRR